MFRLWSARRQRRGFRAAFEAAIDTREPRERVNKASHALAMAHAIDPWPFWYPHRGWIISRLHRAIAHAYIAIREENPPLYSGLLVEHWQEAAQHLASIGGQHWARAMVSLSIAHAENLAGTHGDSIERAIETAETVLRTLHPDRHREEWIEGTANLATYYMERKRGSRTENVEQSIRLLEDLYRVLNAHGTRILLARTLVLLGSAYAQRRKFDAEENIETAIEYLDQGLWLLPEDAEPHTRSTGQLNLCMAYSMRLRGDPKENHRHAVEASERCVAGFEQLGDRPQWARALMIRFSLFEDAPSGAREENWQEAVRCAEQALTVFTAHDYPEEYAQIIRSLDQIRSRRHDRDRPETLEDVIRDAEKTLSQLSPEENPSHYASLLVHLGNTYAERVEGVRAENMERSIELLERAVALLDQRAEPTAWASTMNNLAQSYQERVDGLFADNIEKALAISEEALVVVSPFSEPELHSALLETLGTGFFERVRGDRRRNLQTALEVHGKAQVRRDVDANSEAWLRLQHKYRQARWALGATGDREETSADVPVADFEEYLGSLQSAAGLVSAQVYPRTWVAAQLELADAFTRFAPPGIGDGYDSLADAIYAQCEKALPIYESTVPVVAGMREDDRWSLVQERIAITHRMMYVVTRILDNPDGSFRARARKHYELALAAYGEVLKNQTFAASPRKHLGASVEVARLHVYESDWSRANEQFESAAAAADRLLGDVELSESETKSALRDLGVIANFAPFVSLMLGQPDRSVALAEAGRARLLAKALTLESLPLPTEDRDRLHALQRAVIAQEHHLTSPRLFDRRTPLEESIRLRREIRDVIDRTNPGARLQGFHTQALDALVRDGSVIVIPVLSEEGGRIVVCVRDSDETRFHVAECLAIHALREIFESRTAKDKGWKHDYLLHSTTREGIPETVLRAVGRSLAEVFATPLAELLESLGIRDGTHLDIVLQGPLGILPLGLAADRRSGLPLYERYELSFTPSLTALAHANVRAARKPASPLVVIDPSLPSARAEAKSLRAWFPACKVFEVDNASREEIAGAFPASDLWHFAMHGKFDPKSPLQSGLILRHGDLTLDMLFETSRLGSPRLVVLSACETGLYDLDGFPDEFIGLPVGFLQAGAAGVIATLWPVEDASTALLMRRFYEAYLGEGRTPSAALRIAQLWLRRETRYVSPKHWAGFVHYGV